MSNYLGIKQELENIYLKVVEKFPEIKKEGIKIKYDPARHGFAFIDKKYFSRLFSKNLRVHATIIAGDLFFRLNYAMQEANMAHELGHYKDSARNLNPNRIIRRVRWNKEADDYEKLSKDKWLRKWNILQEIYADNRAAEKGYEIPLLAFLKTVLEKFSFFPGDYYKSIILTEMSTARINNLERILKTKD